jgi:hypothetical protein
MSEVVGQLAMLVQSCLSRVFVPFLLSGDVVGATNAALRRGEADFVRKADVGAKGKGFRSVQQTSGLLSGLLSFLLPTGIVLRTASPLFKCGVTKLLDHH